MLILYDSQCADYGSAAWPEQPARVLKAFPYLQANHPEWAWRVPSTKVADDTLLLAHTPAHLKRLMEPRDFDPDTPYYPGIAAHARRAVGAAIEAAHHALTRHTPVFSLMRPPGHHVGRSRPMGFCYLNQVAIAALVARQRFGAVRVAVWDFDAHHGNGTEEILQGRQNFLYCSVHQSAGFPGTGTAHFGNARNWALGPHTPRAQHMDGLRASWDAVVHFRPDLVLISAGFDAFVRDPITTMNLEREDFASLGRWVLASGFPAAAILEGGYSEELPELIGAFLGAWIGKD
jgi:acetoin utilization deacetylase AcuC-like enzyme